MKRIAFAWMATLAVIGTANAKDLWVTVDNDVLTKIRPSLAPQYKSLHSTQGATIMKLTAREIEQLSDIIHNDLHRCGGFMAHDSYEDAFDTISYQGEMYFAKSAVFSNYQITQRSAVNSMLPQLEEIKIRNTIIELSNFKTRHHKSKTGQESSLYIRDEWAKLASHRSDVTVEFFEHKSTPQPSIIITIPGSQEPDDIIIVGGHADSIAGFWGGANAKAPGADDNASGIATMTETFRVLMNNNFKPKKTVMFMAYAAEEVGLIGSKEIAQKFKRENKNVVGVVQLDMTLFKGTPDKDIVLMSDYTNAAQNEFLGQLIDEYVKVPWGYSRCGYACSDHASWSGQGYPASMPHEAAMSQSNKKIHSAHDTLQTAGGDAKHALKFAKLALSYIVELAN